MSLPVPWWISSTRPLARVDHEPDSSLTGPALRSVLTALTDLDWLAPSVFGSLDDRLRGIEVVDPVHAPVGADEDRSGHVRGAGEIVRGLSGCLEVGFGVEHEQSELLVRESAGPVVSGIAVGCCELLASEGITELLDRRDDDRTVRRGVLVRCGAA